MTDSVDDASSGGNDDSNGNVDDDDDVFDVSDDNPAPRHAKFMRKRVKHATADAAAPRKGEWILVDYQGMWQNDDGVAHVYFDTTANKNFCPVILRFGMDPTLKVFDEVLPEMRVGSVAEVHCSSDYAYGSTGFRQAGIPPYATMLFKITLTSILAKEDVEERDRELLRTLETKAIKRRQSDAKREYRGKPLRNEQVKMSAAKKRMKDIIADDSDGDDDDDGDDGDDGNGDDGGDDERTRKRTRQYGRGINNSNNNNNNNNNRNEDDVDIAKLFANKPRLFTLLRAAIAKSK